MLHRYINKCCRQIHARLNRVRLCVPRSSTGCGNSKTLLHNDVAANHGKMLAADYKNRWSKLSRDAARLRFVTVLHSVVLRRVFEGSGTWMLGAVEIEIVNIELLRRVSALS